MRSGRRKGRGWEHSKTGVRGGEDSAGRRSPARRGRGSEQSPIPPPTPRRICSHVPYPSLPRSARPRLLGLESPSAPALAVLTSGWAAAPLGRRVRPDPTGSAAGPSRGAGPPLAGRGAGRRGGCHASRELRNLGLKATPSGGGGGCSSRALRPPARGGVRRPSPPPPPLPGLPPARPPPARVRPPHPGRTWLTPRSSPLPPRPRSSLGPHPPLPPNLSEPHFFFSSKGGNLGSLNGGL